MIFFRFVLLSLFICFSSVVCIATEVTTDKESILSDPFIEWKKDFEQQALKAGIKKSFLKKMLPKMRLLPEVKKADSTQAEFISTFWDYADKAVSESRIDKGKRLSHYHYNKLAEIHQKYGIAPHYILAFWGMETNYGEIKGQTDVLSALTTLAYDKRRRAFFTNELIAFLKILYENDINAINGSWAGAFGNFQFMPTTFLAYAVDADKDGKKDIVHSMDDSFESAANYLSSMGWNPKIKWGREVRLPQKLPMTVMGKELRIREWIKLGVVPANGTRWEKTEEFIPATLYLPMGIKGPAFLGYPNFKIIMRWNRSLLYALSIGLLADRLSNQEKAIYSHKDKSHLTKSQVQQVQEILSQLGYYDGVSDGFSGKKTRHAVRQYQNKNGLFPDGYISTELYNKITNKGVKK